MSRYEVIDSPPPMPARTRGRPRRGEGLAGAVEALRPGQALRVERDGRKARGAAILSAQTSHLRRKGRLAAGYRYVIHTEPGGEVAWLYCFDKEDNRA